MKPPELHGPLPGVSVVVPTYNEAGNLPLLLGRLKAALGGKACYEILIADDRSPDGTASVAEALRKELCLPLRVVSREGSRSLSLSVIAGAFVARFGCVVVLDGDLSHDPGQCMLAVSGPHFD